MKALLFLAKAAISLMWLILLFNIVSPFPGEIATMLYIIGAFLLVMHAMQTLIFVRAFSGKIPMTRWDKSAILLFGVFALIDIRRKYLR